MKSLPSTSAELRWALIMFFFLLSFYIVALLIYWFGNPANRNWLEWLGFFVIGVVGIPIIVYWLVYFISIKEESRYPEIDRIWEGALAECEQQGISVLQVPIFIVLGTKDHSQIDALVQAGQLPTPVKQNSAGGDLSVFGGHDGIYLFLSGCSCLSGLGKRPFRVQQSPGSVPSAPAGPAVGGTVSFDQFGAPGGSPAGPSPSNSGLSGTMVNFEATAPASPDAGRTLNPASGNPVQGASPNPAGAALGGTIMLPDGMAFPMTQQSSGVAALDSQEQAVLEDKLQHVCRLLRKARGSHCPINGVLSILSLDLVEQAVGPVQEALQSDFAILREKLLVRCANHVLVTGFEKDPGFSEFIKRVGEQMASENRFGKGCDNLWALPTGERLSAVGAHAVGSIEDWVYMLFQKDNALTHRYNSRLFTLLARSRGNFLDNLQKVLAGGFGFDPNVDPELAESLFPFGGCYFAAAGSRAENQAFVKGVFQRVSDREGQLEWAPEALDQDAGYRFSANLFALLGFVSIVAIVGVFVFKFLLDGQTQV